MRWTKVYWETRDGRKLELSEMSDRHIKNCLNMLRRNPEKNKQAIKWFEIELRDRNRALNRGLIDRWWNQNY